MNELLEIKSNLSSKLNFFLIAILPLTLLAGSLISNLTVILICIFFVYELIKEKKVKFISKDFNFYFLIIIYFYLILNSFLIAKNDISFFKSISYLRFIIFTYAVCYYFKIFKKQIIKYWSIVFFVVSIDIVVEFLLGQNIFGFSSNYPGRVGSFTGEELKIGGFYFGFIFITLAFLSNKKNIIFYICLISFFVIALIIGERSNFIKILIMYFLFFLFFLKISYIKKLSLILIFGLISSLIITKIPIIKNRFLTPNFEHYLEVINNEKKFDRDFIFQNNRHFKHYYVAVKIFKDNTLFGSGFKTFRIESYKDKYKKDYNAGSTHPHQFHFEILSELGIVGYILIISNLLYILFRQLNFKKEFLVKGSIIFIIASMTPILPSGSFFTSYMTTIFFINYAFLIKPNKIS